MHKHQLEREIEKIELENERQWELIEELSQGQFKRNTILSKLDYIIKQNKQIMGQIEDLTSQVDDLQASIDTKQAAIASAIAAFEQTIADLQAQIAAGSVATPAQLQAISDKLTAAKADLESTPTA